jgi:integrase
MVNDLHKKGLSYSTVKKAYEAVGGCLRYYRIKNGVAFNPCEGILLPQNTKREISDIKYFHDAQRKKICEEATKTFSNGYPAYRLGWAYVLLMYSGMRVGELCALTWDDIDLKENVINVNKSVVFRNNNRPELSYPKTNKSIRRVEAPKIVIDALKAYRGINIAPKLFHGKDGEYMGQTGYAGEWERIKKKIEAELGHETDLTMYCFRHNYCSELYYSEVSLKEAQRLLGHASYKMIMDVYAHLDAKKEDTRAKLNAIDF